MKNLTLIICAYLFVFVSCTSEKQQLKTSITSAENELKNDTTGILDYKKATAMTALYEQYIEKFPEDTLSAIYLYKAADVAAHSHNAQHAIDLYNKLLTNFPDYKNAANAQFFIGFLYENELKNKPEAIKAYEKFLANYPNDEKVESVQFLIQNINLTDAELIEKFKNMPQNQDSTSHN